MGAALCISIDVELAWGIWDKPRPTFHDQCARLERRIIEGLLALCEAHNISATWAIVGRLLELDESVARSTPHGARIWHAPALVRLVQAARVPQEIASHGYSHIYFTEYPREQLRADLLAARRVHEQHGLAFKSFVFPRNQVGHLDLLSEVGIRVFRSVDESWYVGVRQRFGRIIGRVAHFADKLLPVAPAAVQPVRHGGLVELPSSMLLMGRDGLRRVIPPELTIAKARKGMENAVRSGRTFHLWFHPSNFYVDTDRQLRTVAAIFELAEQMRRAGKLEVRTMGEYAD